MATSPIPMTSGAQPSPGGVSGAPANGVAKTTGTTVTASPANATQNPFVPPTTTNTMPTQPGVGTPGANGAFNTPDTAFGPNSVGTGHDTTAGNLNRQEQAIYGSGVGGAIDSLLNNISGVDSASLQSYIASLQPQEATAQASTNATLGAQGVSGNSSVAAIADSNLQAQETAAIAGESAQLQQSGQQLEAGILTGQEQAAAQETAASGWTVFGDVLGAIGSDVAQGAGAIAKTAGFAGF